jgi:hypothetical protein
MALCVSQLSAAIATPLLVTWAGGKPSVAFLPAAALAAAAAGFGFWMDEGKAAATYASSAGESGAAGSARARADSRHAASAAAAAASAAASAAVSAAAASAAASPAGRQSSAGAVYSRVALDDETAAEEGDEPPAASPRASPRASFPPEAGYNLDLDRDYEAPSAADVLAAQ